MFKAYCPQRTLGLFMDKTNVALVSFLSFFIALPSYAEVFLCTKTIAVDVTNAYGAKTETINIIKEHEMWTIWLDKDGERRGPHSRGMKKQYWIIDSDQGFNSGDPSGPYRPYKGNCVSIAGRNADGEAYDFLRCDLHEDIKGDPVVQTILMSENNLTFVHHFSSPFMSQTSHGTCKLR